MSKNIPGNPRVRLTYEQIDNDTIYNKFEIVMPDNPDTFIVHVEGKSHRKQK